MPYSLLKAPKTHMFRRCSILNAQNSGKWGEKIPNCALLLELLAFFCYTTCIHLLSRTSPLELNFSLLPKHSGWHITALCLFWIGELTNHFWKVKWNSGYWLKHSIQKTQNTERWKAIISTNCRLILICSEQKNDHTQVMHEM